MATYSSYKKLNNDFFYDDSIDTDMLQTGATNNNNIQWIYNERALQCHQCANAGSCVEQANGKCCLWTVPAKVTRVTFEIWSGGGGGAGHTCCNNCSFAIGGAGGNYAIKTIDVTPGDEYTVCAGGSWPCSKSHTNQANMGCRSFVIGNGLNNFCAVGGCGGWMCNGDAWGPREHRTCANCNICGMYGADFGIMGSVGFKMGHGNCHCMGADFQLSGQPPILGTFAALAATESWCTCGCFVNWPAGGGISGGSSYCNNWAKCCAAGSGQGGSGIVRITYG